MAANKFLYDLSRVQEKTRTRRDSDMIGDSTRSLSVLTLLSAKPTMYGLLDLHKMNEYEKR